MDFPSGAVRSNWGKESHDWFVELTAPFCKTARMNVGDRVVLELR
jgi:hypothetical protein